MNGAVCVDASVAAKWLLPEDGSNLALQLLEDALAAERSILGPPHLPAEVTSAVYKRLNDRDLTLEESRVLLEGFESLPLSLSSPPGLSVLAVELSHAFGWRWPYDAFYLALGEILDCDVWTADERFFEDAHGRHARLRLLADYS